MRRILSRLKNLKERIKIRLRLEWRRFRLRRYGFSVIANNCWGAEVYKYFGLPFQTPFIGLFLYPDDFLNLLENWEQTDKSRIQVGYTSRYRQGPLPYPVGILGEDIEVHFLHYKTAEEAETKWKRRAARLPASLKSQQVFVRFCDRDGATAGHFERLARLSPHACIAYSVLPLPYSFVCQGEAGPQEPGMVADGVTLFNRELERGFDPAAWLNTGRPEKAYSGKKKALS